MYKSILIPTDGSELAQTAVSHGLALAKAVGAKVIFLTATAMWSPSEMAAKARHEQQPIEHYESQHTAWANKALAPCKTAAERLGVPCTLLHISDMDPDTAITDAAKSRGCDLIVMASHGRGPIGRLLLGSVALKVLTHSMIPVLIVR